MDHPDKKLIIMYLTSLYHGLREYTPRGGRKRRKLDVSFLCLWSIPRVENHLNQIRRERNTPSTRCNWKAGKRAWARFFFSFDWLRGIGVFFLKEIGVSRLANHDSDCGAFWYQSSHFSCRCVCYYACFLFPFFGFFVVLFFGFNVGLRAREAF